MNVRKQNEKSKRVTFDILSKDEKDMCEYRGVIWCRSNNNDKK